MTDFLVDGRMPNGFLRNRENILRYMDWLGTHRGNRTMEDWYSLSIRELETNYGGGLYAGRDSLFQKRAIAINLLEYTYPEYEWLPWRFPDVPNGFFDSEENQERWLRWYERENNFQSPEDWYEARSEWFDENGADSFLKRRFDDSPQKLLLHHFPELIPWLFRSGVPRRFWDSDSNKRSYMDWLGERIGVINRLDDWYGVDRKALVYNHGSQLAAEYGSLYEILSAAYPEHDWDDLGFCQHKAQVLMTRILRNNYGEVIHEWSPEWLTSRETGYQYRVDAFIVSLNLPVEFQGEQHGVSVEDRGGEKGLKDTQRRDLDKRNLCEARGYNVLYIDHTWNRTEESLLEMVERFTRVEAE